MKKVFSIVLLVLLMWVSVGYSGCVGPYDYEQLNSNTQSIINEYVETDEKFCENSIYGVEFQVVPYVAAITMFEIVRDIGNYTRDPQKNAKIRVLLNAEIMKYQMLVRVVDYTLQKNDRRRYYMWLDSQQKIKRALRNNVKFVKMSRGVHSKFVQ